MQIKNIKKKELILNRDTSKSKHFKVKKKQKKSINYLFTWWFHQQQQHKKKQSSQWNQFWYFIFKFDTISIYLFIYLSIDFPLSVSDWHICSLLFFNHHSTARVMYYLWFIIDKIMNYKHNWIQKNINCWYHWVHLSIFFSLIVSIFPKS